MRVPWEPSRTSSLLRAVTAALGHSPQFCLGTPTCRPTVEAFITRPVADHQRSTFSTRGGIFLQTKGKTLFCSRRCGIQRPSLRSTVGHETWEEGLGGTVLRKGCVGRKRNRPPETLRRHSRASFHDPHTCAVFLIQELRSEPAENVIHH